MKKEYKRKCMIMNSVGTQIWNYEFWFMFKFSTNHKLNSRTDGLPEKHEAEDTTYKFKFPRNFKMSGHSRLDWFSDDDLLRLLK